MILNLYTTRGVNLTNILLMVVSCVIAFFIPFELFLFSYAVLGPLHYLTEISWLHKSNYYALFFTVFLATIIHVFLFTFIFLLYGAMKSKSTSGYISALVMIACALACFFVLPNFHGHQINAYVRDSYKDFSAVNYHFI